MSQTPLRQQDRAAEADEPCRFPAQFRHAIICRLCFLDRRDASLKEPLSGFCESRARVVRCSKRTPSRFSNAAIRLLRRVFSTPIARAAAEKPPYWTTEAKK